MHQLKSFCIIILILTFGINQSLSQSSHQNRYKLLESKGTIPSYFLNNIESAIKSDYQYYLKNRSDKSSTKATNKLRHLEAFHFLRYQLMSGGKVLFGDSLTLYINQLADHLLSNDPDLRSQINFHTYKSTDFNPVVLEDGTILLPVGLIAQLESEAQLAFFIGHCIYRYQLRQNSNRQLGSREVIFFCNKPLAYQAKTLCELLDMDSEIYTAEADTLAFQLCVSRGYKPNEIISAMDIIEFSELPFGDHSMNLSIFELDSMKIPIGNLPDSSRTAIDFIRTSIENQNNLSFKVRKLTLLELSSKYNTENLLTTNIADQKFQRFARISRYECTHEQLLTGQYIEAFYSAYLISKVSPDDAFAEESMAKALYACAKARRYNVPPLNSNADQYYEGEFVLNNFLRNISSEQQRLITIRFLLEIYKKYSNPFIEQLMNDLIQDVISEDKLTWPMIETKVNKIEKTLKKMHSKSSVQEPEPIENIQTVNTIQNDSLDQTTSKYDRLRKLRKEDFSASSEPEYISDDELQKLFHYRSFSASMSNYLLKCFEKATDLLPEKQLSIRKSEMRKSLNYAPYLNSKGDSLGIGKMLIVISPVFILPPDECAKNILWQRIVNQMKHDAEILSKKYNMSNSIIFPFDNQENDIEILNYTNALLNLYSEFSQLNKYKLYMIPLQTEQIKPICENFGVSYLGFPQIVPENKYLLTLNFEVFDIQYREVNWFFGINAEPVVIKKALTQCIERSMMQCARSGNN